MRRRKSLLSGVILFLLVLMASPFSAQAEERVLSFDVTAVMQSDGSMIVTERIRVNIEHKRIRHGITHAYPIKKRYDGHNLRHYGYELLSVKLDDKPSHYYETVAGYAAGIAIGKENYLAPYGVHTYEIVYKTSGHVRLMKDRDEIYYNVMGNNWELPVDHVSFTLQLPGENENAFIDTIAYTGGLGETGSDYVVEDVHTVRTTRTLKPGEGFTVAMAWEKGIVTLSGESFANILGGNRTMVLGGIFFIILLYYVVLKFVVFRVPKGVVVPLFSPPDGMSPGYMHCMKTMSFTGRMLHADMIWAAVNGFFRLDARNKKEIHLQRIEQTTTTEPKQVKSGGQWAYKWCEDLTKELFGFPPKADLDLRSETGKERVSEAFDHLHEEYSDLQKNLWIRSYTPVIPVAVLFLVLYGVVIPHIYTPALDVAPEEDGLATYMFTFFGLIGLLGLLLYALRRAFFMFTGFQRAVGLLGGSLLCAGILAGLWFSFGEGDSIFLLLFSGTMVMCALFLFNPPGRYTRKGLGKLYQIQGLEMYIRAAEKNRLAALNAPEDTVEKFEELLPYAVAFGCAKAWQKRFDTVLGELEYTPEWVEPGERRLPYRIIIKNVAGAGGVAAAVNAAAKAALAQSSFIGGSSGSSGSSSGSSSRGGSGFGGGSSGGGSGGTRVGGW